MARRASQIGLIVLLGLVAAGCDSQQGIPTSAGATPTTSTVNASSALASTVPPSTSLALPATSPDASAADLDDESDGPGSATASTPASSPAVTGPSIALAQPADALQSGLLVDTSIGGGETIKMVVDTGSNGIVVSRRYVGSGAIPMSPAKTFTGFTYSSSGNSYNGEWMTASIQFAAAGSDGKWVAQTVPIDIRVVEEECTPGTGGSTTPTCSSDESTSSVAMLGVGFDRGSPTSADADMAGPGINPFLHLEAMASGAMPQSYLISADSIILGPTATDLAGVQTVSLTPTSPPAGVAQDWASPASCVAVPSAGVAEQCGTLLLDTGLGYAIIQVPESVEPPVGTAPSGERPSVDAGQQIVISVTGLTSPIYSFTIGAAGAPPSVQWGHNLTDGKSFMNISRYALSQTDYYYNASVGQVGFRPAG